MNTAANYAGRLGLTAWRRKSTVLGAAAGVLLLLLCVQYSSLRAPANTLLAPLSQDQQQLGGGQDDGPAGSLRTLRYLPAPPPLQDHDGAGNHIGAQQQRAVPGMVQFLAPEMRAVVRQVAADEEASFTDQTGRAFPGEQPSREEIARRQGRPAGQQQQLMDQQYSQHNAEQLEQMGVARVALDPNHPLVPRQRLVHLDLKGAPPKMDYLRRLLPVLKKLGATGLLLEWEDMFPFSGRGLAKTAATNHYTPSEVRSLLVQANDLDLETVPLVQTFGHLEFVLKHEEFEGLREVPESPQALCPSLNSSLNLVSRMLDQVVAAHAAVRRPRYVHIGCDEVFNMGECSRCRQKPRDDLFLSHVSKVAHMVRTRYNATPIIWDDMLRHVPTAAMAEWRLGELVEPMVWVYAENVYRFVLPAVWDKYASVFPTIWTASAFKGAFGETLYVPNAKRHLENNLRWLEVMTNEAPKFRDGFAGIALTGWQRYDHFAVLCELLPSAVPSLALSLAATTHGYFNTSLRPVLHSALKCPPPHQSRANNPTSFVNLNNDPYLWDRFSGCAFPGVAAFRLTSRLDAAERDVEDFLAVATKRRGWLTDYNVRHNFTSPLRIEELMSDHSRLLHTMLAMSRSAKEALGEAFDGHTVGEWVEQRILPYVKRLEQLQKDTDTMKERKIWPARPLPLDLSLRRLGLEVPVPDSSSRREDKQTVSRGKK